MKERRKSGLRLVRACQYDAPFRLSRTVEMLRKCGQQPRKSATLAKSVPALSSPSIQHFADSEIRTRVLVSIMANPTRILVADEHAPVRGLIAKKPDCLVCAEAAYGKESVEIAKKSCPDLARLDIEMPRMNGIEAAKEILRICPATIILSDSSHDVSLFLAELKDIGVKGFGFKSRIGIDVIPTVQAVLNGESRFPS